MEIIHKRLKDDHTLNKRTNLSADDIIELLRFCMSTTYFLFDGDMYEQIFGTAMGSPVSVVIANLYMEWWEQTALSTCPAEIRPSLWWRFVDDIFEKIKKGTVQQITDHLNTVDETESIKVVHEQESNKSLPMLDARMCREDSGTVSVEVYRKKTHTDQYLAFTSNHPLNHKLSVVRTLIDRSNTIVTKQEKRTQEEEHIRGALQKCGYPRWTIDKVKEQRSKPPEQRKQGKQDKPAQRSLGRVNLPYVAGLSESFARILKKYNIQSTMKPCNTLRQQLVHPKDKRSHMDTAGVLYRISCKQCPRNYIGETGRRLGVRIKEHQDDVKKKVNVRYTRNQRKMSTEDYNKSALTDHTTQQNHVIDWDSTKIVGREDQYLRRQIRESIRIRQETKPLNRDKGNYPLPSLWGPLLVETASNQCASKHAVAVKPTKQAF